METFFAPARRTERRQFKNQLMDVNRSPVMNALLQASEGVLVILNEDRQIIAMNHAFLEKLGLTNIQEALGLRLGESLSCIHAFEKPHGCGTTEHCVTCGAAIAMMTVIRDRREDEQICALVSDKKGEISDICLQIKAKPITVDGNAWVLFYAQDITRQQFWLNMDRVFFHDINNTLTALYGNIQLLEMRNPGNEEISGIRNTIERLVREIAIQKDFSHHRDAAFTPTKTTVKLSRIKKDLDTVVSGHKASFDREITASWPEQDLVLETDHLLLSRVLGNMVLNALEATPRKGNISITVTGSPDEAISFKVWNPTFIPAPVQKRIFQRYFSSKDGNGRGLGTYSMKLFGESYLKGSVGFTSTETEGTVFTFTLPPTKEPRLKDI
jgi:nitrogen fixation/metabolism regulation signal transduction histidine kinase